MQAPSDLIQSVSRALRVLEVVGDHPAGVPPKVIARRAELNLSTTYHLLRTLAYEGYLIRDGSGDYALGLSIADRFADLRRGLSAPRAASAVLRQVSDATGFSAYLARFVEGRIAITTVVEGPGSPHLEDLIPGFDDGAHATAIGKALLSRLGPATRRAYLAEQGLRRFTDGTVVELDELDHELAQQDRVFTEHGQYHAAISCAAALVDAGRGDGDGDGRDRWWAIALAAPSSMFLRRRAGLTRTLLTAAGDLAAA